MALIVLFSPSSVEITNHSAKIAALRPSLYRSLRSRIGGNGALNTAFLVAQRYFFQGRVLQTGQNDSGPGLEGESGSG